MTIAENLSFPLEVRNMGKSEREAKIKRALDMVEMGAFGGRRPAQLSGGQQQRVALARALVFEPELVLMDEPLGALDKQLREKMQFEITHLAHNLGITVVYVTHDQTEALTMSDRVAVFNDGRDPTACAAGSALRSPRQQLRCPVHRREQHARRYRSRKSRMACRIWSQLDDGELIDCKPIHDVSSKPASGPACPSVRNAWNSTRSRLQRGCRILLKAEVLEFIYMGDIYRTRLRVAGNDEFIIKIAERARSGAAGARDLRSRSAGFQRIAVRWDA